MFQTLLVRSSGRHNLMKRHGALRNSLSLMTALFAGWHGHAELKRASANPIGATVGVGDVNPERRRFSFSQDIQGQLISGDQVDIVLVTKGNLDFIVGHDHRDWRGYVFIDLMGGIRLYDTFDAAIGGEADQAIELKAPSAAQEIVIQTRDSRLSLFSQDQRV